MTCFIKSSALFYGNYFMLRIFPLVDDSWVRSSPKVLVKIVEHIHFFFCRGNKAETIIWPLRTKTITLKITRYSLTFILHIFSASAYACRFLSRDSSKLLSNVKNIEYIKCNKNNKNLRFHRILRK